MIGFANKNKPTVIGIDNKVMILTVLLVNVLKLSISLLLIYKDILGNNTAVTAVIKDKTMWLIFVAAE